MSAGTTYPGARLRSQLTCYEVVLGRHAKGIGYTVEEGKHCDYVNSLGDLVFRPACFSQFLDVLMCGVTGCPGYQFCILEQRMLSGREVCLIELSLGNGCDRLIGCSLNPQEVSVTVDSIRTAVQRGNISSKHLLMTPREMPLGEVNSI